MGKQETVLVTGATSGIGLLIANKLHENGFKVYGTSRNPENNKTKVSFELLLLDVSSQESINRCIEMLLTKTQGVDILINNAGAFLGGSVEETTIEQAYKQFETNFWGTVRVTKAILPIMRKQLSGKIITTGSLVGLIGLPFSSYYSATKHALEGFHKSLRLEVKKFNISVSIIEPSFYRTNIGSSSEYGGATIQAYDKIRKLATAFVEKSIAEAPTPEPVAETVLKIVNTKEPKYSYPIGKNTTLLPALQFLSPSLFEAGFLRRLKLS